jgi:hypothetical protein
VSSASVRRWRRRKPLPPSLRAPLGALLLALYWPFTKLFAKRWPRFVARTMTKFLSGFPRDFVATANDVLICSYYKSGTNWTMQIAVQIAHRGRAEFDHIHELVPWPDLPPAMRVAVPLDHREARASAPTGLRVIKTHMALDALPYSPAARYVCVVRDPKDVFVSSYHFTEAMVLGPLMPTVDAWLDAYLSPDTPLGSWARHLASGWQARDRGNVLFLTYESMRADLPRTVDAIAAFMGVALEADERAAVIERAAFSYMKKEQHKFDSTGSPWTNSQGSMLRRGESGRSGELLSPEQQRRIDDYWRAELGRMRCDFPYDTAFGRAARG